MDKEQNKIYNPNRSFLIYGNMLNGGISRDKLLINIDSLRENKLKKEYVHDKTELLYIKLLKESKNNEKCILVEISKLSDSMQRT